MIQIRQVSKYVYDVFGGTGFLNWTRIRLNTWGVQCLGGIPLSQNDCQLLEGVILRLPHGSVETVEVVQA